MFFHQPHTMSASVAAMLLGCCRATLAPCVPLCVQLLMSAAQDDVDSVALVGMQALRSSLERDTTQARLRVLMMIGFPNTVNTRCHSATVTAYFMYMLYPTTRVHSLHDTACWLQRNDPVTIASIASRNISP